MIWLSAAILLGLTGALHCAVMCGPLVSFYTANSPQTKSKMLKYHLGRISAYAVLGALVGVLSASIQLAGFQKWMSILMGITLILGLGLTLLIPKNLNNNNSKIQKLYNKLRVKLIQIAKKDHQNAPFYFGIANGFIPCGLVYTAMASAMIAPNFISMVLFMLIFGIFNSPGLVFTSVLTQKIKLGSRFRPWVRYTTLMIVAAILIYRGLNINPHSQHNTTEAGIISTCD
jgi:sulfite exporter TauE/SafE